MGKTITGKSYTDSGSSGCLTDLLGLEDATVENILREEEHTNSSRLEVQKESPQMSWSSFKTQAED